MNLRIAKKVLLNPDKYTGQQRYNAAHRLYRRASTFKDGVLGFWALKLKPQRSFVNDDQLDLRFEYFLSRWDKLEDLDFPPGDFVISKEELRKPVFRKDGQVANFAALAYPTKVRYESETVLTPGGSRLGGEVTVLNKAVAVEMSNEVKRWEMGEWRTERPFSRKKYHIREAKVAGKRPPRLKRKNFGLPELIGPDLTPLRVLLNRPTPRG